MADNPTGLERTVHALMQAGRSVSCLLSYPPGWDPNLNLQENGSARGRPTVCQFDLLCEMSCDTTTSVTHSVGALHRMPRGINTGKWRELLVGGPLGFYA
jgi:hypothetical protein